MRCPKNSEAPWLTAIDWFAAVVVAAPSVRPNRHEQIGELIAFEDDLRMELGARSERRGGSSRAQVRASRWPLKRRLDE